MEPIKASFGPMTFELTLDGRELALLTALAAKRGGDASARTTRMELLVRMAVQFGLAHLRPHLEFEEQEQVDEVPTVAAVVVYRPEWIPDDDDDDFEVPETGEDEEE